ncbi:MAG: nicotinate-nucleotide--dimethylbenzimidazole phosphoribosyltransferase [Burkholderiales bacterium PBB5]|nr:MAG: nicotinate-nucleotide--dimethylbenzimidazole phosphoribosyltransferase [Burkholderiales bacterium PBB5]
MSLIAETSNPLLEQALLSKLAQRGDLGGQLGALEPVAVRLGLLQNSLKPRFRDPQLVLFAADHGLAVEGLPAAQPDQTGQQVQQVLAGQLPVAVFAHQLGLALSVVDCGVARQLPGARMGPAMSLDQAHAAIRAGMEIGDTLRGNLVACAGLGVGSHEAAALVIARLAQSPVAELLLSGSEPESDALAHLMIVAQGALGRHRDVTDAVEVLAAFGGFETAVMVGVMLVAASKRHLIMVDGMAACAALLVASRISAPVIDYALFCRSRAHPGLDKALALFRAAPLLELGLDTADGTGACLSWPLVRCAAALLSDLDAQGAPDSHAGALGDQRRAADPDSTAPAGLV